MVKEADGLQKEEATTEPARARAPWLLVRMRANETRVIANVKINAHEIIIRANVLALQGM